MAVTVGKAARRLCSLEGLALVVAAMFFSSVTWYLQPLSREHLQSTSVATRSALVDETLTWSPDVRSVFPRSYRLMHMRCIYADPVDNADQEQHIRLGRVPVLFIHGNAGSFDLVRSIASLLPLGKWPAMTRKPLEDVSTPALGMTVFSVDLNEDANIHSGAIMIRQAKFARRALSFIKRRFVSYYVSRGRDVCTSHAIRAAANDFASQSMPSDPPGTSPATFCTDAWREVHTVDAHGVWVIGHSMGGIVARLVAILELQQSPKRHHSGRLIAGIITINTPHRYPPIVIDSEVLRLYRIMHWHWAVANGDDDNRGGTPLAHHVCPEMAANMLVEQLAAGAAGAHHDNQALWCLHHGPMPPVMSIHGGALDEQVFFETTAMEQHHHGMTLFTGHMVDCGYFFDHNAIIWSLEFVEPFVEAVWRLHTRLVRGGGGGGVGAATPTGALRASLLSVFDAHGVPPPASVQGSKKMIARLSVLCPGAASVVNSSSDATGASPAAAIDGYIAVLVPIRLQGCSSLEAFVALENRTRLALPINAAFQHPLLQRVTQTQDDGGEAEEITTWSVLFVDAKPLLSIIDGAAFVSAPFPMHIHGACDAHVGVAAAPVGGGSGSAGFALQGKVFEARRGDAYWFTAAAPVAVPHHCLVMPSGILRDPGTYLQQPNVVARITFLKLAQGQAVQLWRAYADGSYVLMCTNVARVQMQPVHHVPLRWVNWMVVFEGGPLLIFFSAWVVAISVALEICGFHHRRAAAIAVAFSLLFSLYVIYPSNAPMVVPLTCALAGSGVGVAVMRTFGAINGGVHAVICWLWCRSPGAACSARVAVVGRVFTATLVVAVCWLHIVADVFYPIVAWAVAAHLSDRVLRNFLSIAAVLCFHTSGSVFHVKNLIMGSSVAPLAPEHQEASVLLLAAASITLMPVGPRNVQKNARVLTIPAAQSLMLALLEVSIRVAQQVTHQGEVAYWDASAAAHCTVWMVISLQTNRMLLQWM